MKVAHFLEMFAKRYNAQMTNEAVFERIDGKDNTMCWGDLYDLKEATKYVDYDCQFDEAGICKGKRRYINARFPQQGRTLLTRCCCIGCGRGGGYLRNIPNDFETIKTMARLFDNGRWKRGFWRAGKGCILPRKYRSVTCLDMHCNPNLSKSELRLLDAIRHGPEWIRANVDNSIKLNWAIKVLTRDVREEWRERQNETAKRARKN
jgi:hypothetical protein